VSLTLTPDELVALTGRKRPRDQLAELQRRGFARAFINAAGAVTLTRTHFEAVEAGARNAERPKVRPALRRVA
jgi:hypothetical protein